MSTKLFPTPEELLAKAPELLAEKCASYIEQIKLELNEFSQFNRKISLKCTLPSESTPEYQYIRTALNDCGWNLQTQTGTQYNESYSNHTITAYTGEYLS